MAPEGGRLALTNSEPARPIGRRFGLPGAKADNRQSESFAGRGDIATPNPAMPRVNAENVVASDMKGAARARKPKLAKHAQWQTSSGTRLEYQSVRKLRQYTVCWSNLNPTSPATIARRCPYQLVLPLLDNRLVSVSESHVFAAANYSDDSFANCPTSEN